MFIELPVIPKNINATINEIGIVSTIIKVARQRPKKNKTIKTTKANAYNKVSERLLIELLINSEESKTGSITTSGGRVFCISSNSFLTSLATFTVFAPDCF